MDLYAVIETADNVYIVMELVEVRCRLPRTRSVRCPHSEVLWWRQGGELFDHVVDRGAYS